MSFFIRPVIIGLAIAVAVFAALVITTRNAPMLPLPQDSTLGQTVNPDGPGRDVARAETELESGDRAVAAIPVAANQIRGRSAGRRVVGLRPPPHLARRRAGRTSH